MIGVTEAFSPSYAKARSRFLESAAAAGLRVESHPHPLPGRDGEPLAMDVALDGAPDARSLLIVTSACHGVEGYCGTGVQVFALHDAEWREKARAQGVAVLYIHALNPYGFSHIRRVTHENVDLNRNFHDFSKPLPVNEAYRELQPLLLPAQWPPAAGNTAAIGQYIAARGEGAYQAAITRGQHEFPEGLFFGGTEPTWSNRTLRQVLRQHGRRAARLAWIDLHTGLGPSGVGERIYAGNDDAAAVQRARAWWGGNGATPVTSIYDGSSTSAFLTGLMWTSIYDECPQAEFTGIAMEYGTVPVLDVMQALRAEHWLNIHRDAPAELARQIKQQMLEAFYTDTDLWKGQIISQARQALFQAVDGLNS
ncbi:M14 family metallopeptidase [Variovorax terrae]|uniref:M14 family metallopeptidase n=1 Tax=Variovorax terrae TaxID=2923278 RepID=A0A9X2AS44_9BURK|nr:M14 family metallopeptidase [Variovorax terrae]MCJ0764871.1 M14 family metallopeptidase [Variovorax terrae]